MVYTKLKILINFERARRASLGGRGTATITRSRRPRRGWGCGADELNSDHSLYGGGAKSSRGGGAEAGSYGGGAGAGLYGGSDAGGSSCGRVGPQVQLGPVGVSAPQDDGGTSARGGLEIKLANEQDNEKGKGAR